MRWIDEIIYSFKVLGGDASYDNLYHYIERHTNRELTDEWKASVRKVIEDYSSDSENYKDKRIDYFYKIGKGHWGLRKQYL